MGYSAWSVVFGEQPSAAKWNILGTNDSSFNDGTGIGSGVIGNSQLATGALVQVGYASTSTVATGTTTVPNDDTIPQNTEGDQYLSLAFTPKAATNTLVIDGLLFLSSSVATAVMAASVFQDSTAGALANGTETLVANSAAPHMVKVRHQMTAGTTSSTTFKIRAGAHTASTTTNNGISGGELFGAIPKSSIMIMEFKV